MRRGFTLTELLVSIAIIGTLASMVLGALSLTVEQGRERKSLASVKALGDYIQRRTEEYAVRRLPVTQQNLQYIAASRGWSNNPAGWQRARLEVLRELMRLEMPYRWADIDPASRQWDGSDSGEPNLWPVFSQRWAASPPGSDTHQGAETLYLIVSSDTDETARAMVARLETGDTDGDGYREFLDGWANPISWQRWPRNYPPSDQHDPWDRSSSDPGAERRDPIVVSPGPDGSLGLWHASAGLTAAELNNPAYTGPEMVGERINDDWMDNITSKAGVR